MQETFATLIMALFAFFAIYRNFYRTNRTGDQNAEPSNTLGKGVLAQRKKETKHVT